MKKVYISVILTSVLTLLLFYNIYSYFNKGNSPEEFKVGFLYEDDESTPYTYNFALTETTLQETYPDKIQILS